MRWLDTRWDWKPIFCFLPRLIDGQWVWLERVEHRLVSSDLMLGPEYEFRLPAIAIEARQRRDRNGLDPKGESAAIAQSTSEAP